MFNETAIEEQNENTVKRIGSRQNRGVIFPPNELMTNIAVAFSVTRAFTWIQNMKGLAVCIYKNVNIKKDT